MDERLSFFNNISELKGDRMILRLFRSLEQVRDCRENTKIQAHPATELAKSMLLCIVGKIQRLFMYMYKHEYVGYQLEKYPSRHGGYGIQSLPVATQ